MRTTMVFAALLAPTLEAAPSESVTTALTCVGNGEEYSFGIGRQKIGPKTYRVVIEGQHATIAQLTQTFHNGLPANGEAAFCQEDGVCNTTVTDTLIEVKLSAIPSGHTGGTATFSLDRKRSRFRASSGGLDYNSSVSGKCKMEKR